MLLKGLERKELESMRISIPPKYFQEVSHTFQDHGVYTQYPIGTYQFDEFWEEETRKCKEGVTHGELYIPGAYYFYLNYTQIELKNTKTGRKNKGFPVFTDVDLEYFTFIEKARKQQKGIVLVKPRRIGFSYKSAAIIAHEFSFFRDAKCIIGAFQSELSENTMRMSLDDLNFLDLYTEWGKERNPNTKDFVKARYKKTVDGVSAWSGYMSEIHSFTFKDNPFAAIGKSSNLFLFEEAGKWPGLLQSYNISEPCWKDGDDLIGVPIIQGTGGDMEGGTQEFAEMFFHPEKYNFLAFDNIWDEDSIGSKCGFFIPATRMRFGTYKDAYKEHPEWKDKPMIDDYGNSLEEVARQSIMDLRKRAEQGADQQAKIDSVTQFPLSPKEAFLQSHSFFFPIVDLKGVLSKMDDSIELDKHSIGILQFEEGELKWKDVQGGTPFREYPVQKPEHGLIEIYETPRLSENGDNIARYIAGIDPYRYDNSSTDSVGSIFMFDRLTRRIVAEYTGRPETTDQFYETCRKLIIYYQATAMYEANITGMYTYFEKKKALHFLADTPYNLRDRNTWRPNTNTSKGIIMSKGVKERGMEYLKSWIDENISEESEEKNLTKIRSIGLLKELIAWNPNPRANFDRVSAMLMVMWYDVTLQEFNRISIEQSPQKKKTASYFDKYKQKRDDQDIWMKHFNNIQEE
jgi:hypothetical protein